MHSDVHKGFEKGGLSYESAKSWWKMTLVGVHGEGSHTGMLEGR